MLAFLTRRKTQRPASLPLATSPEARRRVLETLSAEEKAGSDQLTRLAARAADARDREARARELLAEASDHRAEAEAEQLGTSGAIERRIDLLRRELADGAPPEIDDLRRDIEVLVEHARSKAQTWLGEGFQDLTGRRPTTVSTNTDTIAEFVLAARQVIAELEALRYADVPDFEKLGPFAEVTIPEGQLERARRLDEQGTLVARAVVVPAALADRYVAIGGTASPTPLLSPAAIRETGWAAERAAQRRWNSGESWR